MTVFMLLAVGGLFVLFALFHVPGGRNREEDRLDFQEHQSRRK